MAKLVIRNFGITKDIIGARESVLDFDGDTVGSLRSLLSARYPELSKLRSLMIAVNSSYAEDDKQISELDEIALIPPVSGG